MKQWNKVFNKSEHKYMEWHENQGEIGLRKGGKGIHGV